MEVVGIEQRPLKSPPQITQPQPYQLLEVIGTEQRQRFSPDLLLCEGFFVLRQIHAIKPHCRDLGRVNRVIRVIKVIRVIRGY
jgi:hypothetical protein